MKKKKLILFTFIVVNSDDGQAIYYIQYTFIYTFIYIYTHLYIYIIYT